MSDFSLKDIVKTNTNKDTDVFVGIKCTGNNVSVNFPLGFRLSKDDDGLAKDISLLLKTLERNTEQKESQYARVTNKFDTKVEPIQSYMYIIQDYLSNGVYKEKEVRYSQNNRGKINWNRTIKTQKPSICNGNIFYLNLITKKSEVKNDELITLIHRYCIQVSFGKIWWLYFNRNPIRDNIKLNKNLFRSVLVEKMNNTFNDKTKLLFQHMLAIIEKKSDDDSSVFEYGTYRFEYVWEKMIDDALGIKEKNLYFPKTSWTINEELKNNHKLMPDTIMLNGGDVFIVDAKYYKYGVNREISSLPGTGSITKQIAYGEYVKTNNSNNNNNVYNAFIMPFAKKDKNIEYVGYATSEWKDNDEDYQKIKGILLDVKDLMLLEGNKSKDLIHELSQMIIDKK